MSQSNISKNTLKVINSNLKQILEFPLDFVSVGPTDNI